MFPILGAKRFFPENLALSHTTPGEILATCQNLEKTTDTFPRKPRTDRRTNGRMEEWADPISQDPSSYC